MTEIEFDTIAKLIRSRDPVRSAARLVLVCGKSSQEAAAQSGCSYNSVFNTVTRFKSAHKEIVSMFGH